MHNFGYRIVALIMFTVATMATCLLAILATCYNVPIISIGFLVCSLPPVILYTGCTHLVYWLGKQEYKRKVMINLYGGN